MVTLLTNSVQKIMSQYNLKMDDDLLNKNLICTVCNKIMINAYQTYCGCHYCRLCIIGYLADKSKYCLGGKEECKEERLELEYNVALNPMLNKRILKAKVHCPNKTCPCITEIIKMEEHLMVCTQQSMECPYSLIGCENIDNSKENILAHLRDDTLTHSHLLLELVQNFKNEMYSLKGDFVSSKLEQSREREVQIEEIKREIMEEHRKIVIELKAEIENQRRETNELKKELKLLKLEYDKREHTSVLSFTVDKFSARKRTEETILSPYIYSHTNGYKLRLSVHPGGKGDGIGTHLTVFIRICQGEYDDVLPWPCRHTFTVGIINQRDGGTYASQTLNYATTVENERFVFDKPIYGDNSGYTSDLKFVSHADLQSVIGLVVDDSVIVRCVVSAIP